MSRPASGDGKSPAPQRPAGSGRRRGWRRHLWWLALPGGVVALAAIVTGLSHVMPVNFLKPLAEAQLGDALNRPVTIAGDFWIHVGGRVRFAGTGIAVHNPPGTAFPRDTFLTADRAEVDLGLWSLLQGEPEILRAAVDRGELLFQVRADGVNNWNLSQTTDDTTSRSIGLPPELLVSDSRVALIDVPAGQDSAIEKLRIDYSPRTDAGGEVSALRQAGWNLDASGEINGEPVSLAGWRSAEGPPGIYDLQLDLKSGYLGGSMAGRIHEGPLPGFDGRLDAHAPSVGGLARWLGIPLDPDRADPGSLTVALRMSADGERTEVHQLTVQGSQAAGEAQALFQHLPPGLQIEGAAHFPHLNLDAYLPPPELTPELPSPIANLAILQALRRIASLPDSPVPLDWLERTAGSYSLRIGNLTLRDVELKQSEACFRVEYGVASLALLEDDSLPREEPAASGQAGDEAAGTPDEAAKADAAATEDATATGKAGSGDAAAGQEAVLAGPGAAAADACTRLVAAGDQAPPAGGARLNLSLQRAAPAAATGGTDDGAGTTRAGGVAAGPEAALALDAAVDALPLGALAGMLEQPKGKKGQEAEPGAYLTATADLDTRGATWLRLAAGLHGRLQAELHPTPKPEQKPQFALRAEAATPTAPLTATLDLHRDGHDLTATLDASPLPRILLEDRFALRAELKGDLATGEIDGEVLGKPVTGFKGSIRFRSEHPGPMLAFLTRDPDFDAYDPGGVDLEAELEEDGQRIDIAKAELKAGSAELQLSGSLQRDEVLKADLRLTGRQIDLLRLMPPAGRGRGSGGRDRDSGAAAGGHPAADLFPQRTEVALEATLTEVRGAGIAFDSLELQGRAGEEAIALAGKGVPAGGGSMDFSLALDRDGAQAKGQARLDLRSDDLRSLFRATGKGAREAGGSGSLSAAFSGTGTTLAELAAGLTGQAKLELAKLRGVEMHPIDQLVAELQVQPERTRLTGQASFPPPPVPPGNAVGLVASQEGRPAASSHPVEAGLDCAASLWHCLFAGTAPVNLTLGSGPSRLQFEGEARAHQRPASLQGRLVLSGDSLSDWDGLVNDALPFFGPYRLESRATLRLDRQEFEDLALTVGGSDLAGRLQMHWPDGRPVLSADLRSRRLVTDDFGASKAHDPGMAQAVRVPTGWLNWVRGEAKLAVDELVLTDGWALTDTSAELKSEGGRLEAKQVRGTVLEGRLGLSGSLAPAPDGAAQVSLRGGWRDGSLAALAARLGDPDTLSGRAEILLRTDSRGTSLNELATRPSGEFSLRVDNGHIANSALGLLSVKLSDIFSPLFGSSATTRVNCLETVGAMQHGTVQIPQLVMDTDLFDMQGEGSLSLPEDQVNMDFRIFGNRVAVASLAPAFSVTGPLGSPSISINPVTTALDVAPSLLGSLAGEVAHLFDTVTGTKPDASVRSCAGQEAGKAQSN